MKCTLYAPWKKGAGLSTVIVGEGGEAIASVFPGRTSAETNERADVIIAAPELLALLKEVHRLASMEASIAAYVDDMAAAIAKAEGRHV